jgi:MFS family permease
MFMRFWAGRQNEYWLIAARAAMGVGGALMWPAILGMTFALLPKEKAGLAGGLILGAAGIGQAIGPILGGMLTEYLSWRWTLFINVPIGLLAVFRYLAGSASASWRRPRGAARLRRDGDPHGRAVRASVRTGPGSRLGWTDWRVLTALGVSVAFLIAFPFIERRAGDSALIPGDVIRNRRFAAACGTILLISAAFIASLLYLPQFLQKILDYSPVRAGVGMLPIMLGFAALSFAAGPIYDRIGAKIVVTAGAFLIAVGALLLTFLQEDSGYTALVPGMVVMGIGFGLFYGPRRRPESPRSDESRSSLAGGIAYMAQIAGGSVGLGLTTSIFTALSDRKLDQQITAAGIPLTDAQSDAAHGILGGTQSASKFSSSSRRVAGRDRTVRPRGVRDRFRLGVPRRRDPRLRRSGGRGGVRPGTGYTAETSRTGHSLASPPSAARSKAGSAADCTIGAEARAVTPEILAGECRDEVQARLRVIQPWQPRIGQPH